MIKQTFEFNSFGPWVFEISGAHKLPPLFSNYAHLLNQAHLFLKFPRNIERRKATPNMHLYDTVLGIFSDYILILKRELNKVRESRININDIEYFIRKEFLLNGTIIIKSAKKAITVNYNTVSSDIIDRLIKLIRDLQQRSPVILNLSPVSYKEQPENILFTNAIQSMRSSEPENQLVAFQPRFRVLPKISFFSKLISTTYTPTPSATYLFMINSSELIILDHSSKNEDDKASRYAYSYIYIPLEKITKSTLDPNINLSNSDIFNIALHKNNLYFPVNSMNRGIRSLVRSLRHH